MCGRAEDSRLKELIAEAVSRNPEVTAAQKRYEAARQRPSQASSLPETMFAAGWNASGRPWPGAGLGAEPVANIGFMVSQEFPWPGKRKLRGEMAEVEASAELESLRSIRLSVASRVKQAYSRLGYTHSAREILERSRNFLGRLLRVSEIRYSVGKAAQQDILKIQTQLSILETRLIQLNRERGASEAELNALLNRKPGDPLEPVLLQKPPALAATLEHLLGLARQRSPTLRREERLIQRNQTAVDLARKDVYPDYSVSGGYYNMGVMQDMYMFRLDFKLPTSWFRKQRPAVAESVHTLAGSRKTLEVAAQDLAFRIQDEYLAATTSGRLMRLYEETIVPQGNLTLESSLASYETGAVDLLTVLMNFMTVLDYEMNYYGEMANFLVAVARLEEMTGVEL